MIVGLSAWPYFSIPQEESGFDVALALMPEQAFQVPGKLVVLLGVGEVFLKLGIRSVCVDFSFPGSIARKPSDRNELGQGRATAAVLDQDDVAAGLLDEAESELGSHRFRVQPGEDFELRGLGLRHAFHAVVVDFVTAGNWGAALGEGTQPEAIRLPRENVDISRLSGGEKEEEKKCEQSMNHDVMVRVVTRHRNWDKEFRRAYCAENSQIFPLITEPSF